MQEILAVRMEAHQALRVPFLVAWMVVAVDLQEAVHMQEAEAVDILERPLKARFLLSLVPRPANVAVEALHQAAVVGQLPCLLRRRRISPRCRRPRRRPHST